MKIEIVHSLLILVYNVNGKLNIETKVFRTLESEEYISKIEKLH